MRVKIQIFLLICGWVMCGGAIGSVVVYPGLPNNQYGSELYEVTVAQAGKSLPSYVYKSSRETGKSMGKPTGITTDANHWTSFSFSGGITVQIKLRDGTAVKTAIVRPLAKNIHAEVSNDTVSFTLTEPANVFVELDGKPRDPLFIFANPVENNIPTKAATNVIYFGPGVTDLGRQPLQVADGQTVYLAGGAYVKGRIQAASSTGDKAVTICGRGILSGIDIAERRGVFGQFMISDSVRRKDSILPSAASQLHVEGIVITDPPGPSLNTRNRLTAENIKLLAWPMCTDGISGGEDSLVKDCFLKVNDDGLHFHRSGTKLINNVVWRQSFGSAIQMGWNRAQNVEGELCDGLDIIGDDTGRLNIEKDWGNANVVALMDIHKHATYRNIVIANVRHEKRSSQLFGVRTMLAAEDINHTSFRDGRGSVEGMVFRNITALQKPSNPSVFDGNGREPGSINNVTFENIRIAGELITDENAAGYIVQRGKTFGFNYHAN